MGENSPHMPRAGTRNAWAKPASRRHARWAREPQRRQAVSQPTAGLPDPQWGSPGGGAAEGAVASAETLIVPEAKLSRAAAWRSWIVFRAGRLWSCDYAHFLNLERLEVPELREKVVQTCLGQMSIYRERLTNPHQIAAYDAKTERMIRDQTAVLRRRANQFDIPFSVDARSQSYFNQRVPKRVWKDQQHGLVILHRDSTEKVARTMVEVQPAPPFIANMHVACFGVDQCNHWQASQFSKKGEFRGAERLNKLGMPVTIRSETVLNVVQRLLPFTAPMLTPQEVQLIQANGPYTEDKNNVFAVLNPQRLEREMWSWVACMLLLLMPQEELPDSEEQIVERILGKPRIKPIGRSEFRIHPPIPKCETQSYEDCSKMIMYLSALVTQYCVCIIIFCDGQLEEMLRSCLINHFSQFKRVLIGNGHFHAYVHFLFCGNTGYWLCCLCTFSRWQGKRKQIYQFMKDLQHDNARHVLDFHRTNVAGILSYLILDVTNPSPRLLLRDPQGYLALVHVAGGIVMLQYLFRFGLVAIFWQRTMREGGGKAVTLCIAYAFHFHRACACRRSLQCLSTCLCSPPLCSPLACPSHAPVCQACIQDQVRLHLPDCVDGPHNRACEAGQGPRGLLLHLHAGQDMDTLRSNARGCESGTAEARHGVSQLRFPTAVFCIVRAAHAL